MSCLKEVKIYNRKGGKEMIKNKTKVVDDLGRLELLAEKYPTVQSASTELINLQAISSLPKGTEHFISDLHGEYETFKHIMNNASGAIREKVDLIYGNILPSEERAKLSTLIYYPREKLQEIAQEKLNTNEWYKITLNRLVEVCKLVASKYTRSKVRKALPEDFAYIIDELLHNSYHDPNKAFYYSNIILTIIKTNRADAFIVAICDTIKKLVVDHLHILGDIFDRGPRPDLILDSIMTHHSLDIQWGNHDVIWMGAACGSDACIAVVLNNSILYNNLEFLEEGYGINLRPLALFAEETYKDADIKCFMPRNTNFIYQNCTEKELINAARMHKAIAVMRFKLEGQIIKRNPLFAMDSRLLLDKIDYKEKTVDINGKICNIEDIDFPTVDKNNPYELSKEEERLIGQLRSAFLHSDKLQKHIKFLYDKGNLYKIYNKNLLLHGCVPLNPDGTMVEFKIGGKKLSGQEFLDYAESVARDAYFAEEGSKEKEFGKDLLWFLWCGKNSPLFGKDKMTTFERLLIKDKELWHEEKNAYYTLSKREKVCVSLLKAFGINKEYSHIINGHVPVRCKDGEKPVRANGRLIVIDGGFCRAYQPTTGIAGYTLIYNSFGMRLCSHEPFEGTKKAIKENTDIYSTSVVSERVKERITVGETDVGKQLLSTIKDLEVLLAAYRLGTIKETLKSQY